MSEILTTEDGKDIQSESGKDLLVSVDKSEYETIVNRVVFRGYISKYEPNTDGNGIKITIMSHSQRMNQLKFVNEGTSPYSRDQAGTLATNGVIYTLSGEFFNLFPIVRIQKFNIPSQVSFNLSAIRMWIQDPPSTQSGYRYGVAISNANPYNWRTSQNFHSFVAMRNNISQLANGVVATSYYSPQFQNSGLLETDFNFSPSISLPSGDYWLLFFIARQGPLLTYRQSFFNTFTDDGVITNIVRTSTDKLYDSAGFGIMTVPNASSSRAIMSTVSTHNLRMNLIGSSTGTTLKVDDLPHITLDQLITYARCNNIRVGKRINSSVDKIKYQFKNVFILNALTKFLNLLVGSYFGYIEYSNNDFIFKSVNNVDIYEIKSQHLRGQGHFKITNEHVVNQVYFLGGIPEDENGDKIEDASPIYTFTEQQTPYTYKRAIDLNDNRIITEAEAKAISRRYIDYYSNPFTSGRITVNRNLDFDIEAIRCGDRVKIIGLSHISSSFEMTVIAVSIHPSFAVLTLGYIIPNFTDQIQNTRTGIIEIRDVDVDGSAT